MAVAEKQELAAPARGRTPTTTSLPVLYLMGQEPPAELRIGEGRVAWIPLSLLRWGERNPYQRKLRPTLVEEIRDRLEPRSLAVLEVVDRRDGKFWVKDGQHRVEGVSLRAAAAHAPGHSSDPYLLCHIIVNESIQEEAHDARTMNMRRKGWDAYNSWKSALVEKDPFTLQVKGMLDRWHVEVPPSGPYRSDERRSILFAIGSVVNLCHRESGFELTEKVVEVLRNAWPQDNEAFTSVMLMGVAQFLAEQWEFVDDQKLVAALRKTAPAPMVDDARAMKANSRRAFSLSTFLCLVIEAEYNRTQHRNKLPGKAHLTYARSLPEWEMSRRRARQRQAAVAAP